METFMVLHPESGFAIGKVTPWQTASGEIMWKGESFITNVGCLYYDRQKTEDYLKSLIATIGG